MQTSLFAQSNFQPELVEGGGDTANTAIDWLNKGVKDTVFTVIDLETTGLNSKKNAITEIVAIQFKNGIEIAKFSTLVKPTEPVTPESEAITGISQAMVENAPALINVLSDLASFVGPNPILVGHNVGFDIGFLREKLRSSFLNSFSTRFEMERAFCTKKLAQKAAPGLPSYEGIVVGTHFGVVNDNPHRAEYDVRMCAGILFAIIDQHPEWANVGEMRDFQGVLS